MLGPSSSLEPPGSEDEELTSDPGLSEELDEVDELSSPDGLEELLDELEELLSSDESDEELEGSSGSIKKVVCSTASSDSVFLDLLPSGAVR